MDAYRDEQRLEELFACCHPAPWPHSSTPLVLYGAGHCGRDALRVLRKNGYRVVAFVDATASETGVIESLPCHPPRSPHVRALAQSGAAAVLTVFNFTTDPVPLAALLTGSGFSEVLPYHALDAAFPDQLRSRFWLAPRTFWEAHYEDLRQTLRLWEDSLSREIFLDLVTLRLTGNLQTLCKPDRNHQYIPRDLPPLRAPVRFVDGGAFTGDTLAALSDHRLEAAMAFEPDPENFRHLRQWASEHAGNIPVTLFPYGLGSASAIGRFQPGRSAASAFQAQGDTSVRLVALDQVLGDFAPTFIKLDIEGAETVALEGARETLEKYRPRAAVCLYHRPEHLWEIPLALRHHLPAHSLHLRYHGFNGFDAVAYAIES